MIRVRKPAQVPRVLRERGVVLTAELCSKVDAGEPPSFDRDIYGAADVKQTLRTAQHDKCCFCESKLGHAQFGDVEHFRPKAAAQQSVAAAPATGYYRLAYVWDNLYLSCEVCNRRHKRGLFPLLNPEARVASHHRADDLATEQPVFVDPGNDDPTTLIEFRREYAAAVEGDARGAATIEALQLNRPALRERRRERHQMLLACVIVLAEAIRAGLSADNRASVTYVLDAIVTSAADHGEHSSMTRSLLRHVAPWRQEWAPPAAALLDALKTEVAGGLTFQVDQI